MNDLREFFAELIAEGYEPTEALSIVNQSYPGVQLSDVQPIAQSAATSTGNGLLSRFAPSLIALRGKFGAGKSIGGNGLNLSLKGANNLLKDVGQTKLGGMKLGNIGLGLYGAKQGLDLFNEANNLNASYTDLEDLRKSAISSAYANPMVNSYLNSEDQRTLRQLRNGSFGQQNPVGAAAGGAVKNLPDALKSALVGYLVSGGNPFGAILGGGSSLIKGGMKGISDTNTEKANRLQALYSNLRAAEDDYNYMRRPANLRSAGLSSRAYAGLY